MKSLKDYQRMQMQIGKIAHSMEVLPAKVMQCEAKVLTCEEITEKMKETVEKL